MIGSLTVKIINEDPLKKYKWVVFGSDRCQFCIKAIHKLLKHDQMGVYITLEDVSGNVELDNYKYFFNNKTIQKEIKKFNKGKGYKHIPMVFYKGKFIGGYEDLEKEVDAIDKEV